MPATCDVDMNTRLVKRCELQVFDLDRNPVLWRRVRRLPVQGGGFKRRHLYQSGKGVSFFLTKPSSKTSKTGQWRFCPLDSRGGRVLLKKGDTLSALVQMTPFKPLAVVGV